MTPHLDSKKLDPKSLIEKIVEELYFDFNYDKPDLYEAIEVYVEQEVSKARHEERSLALSYMQGWKYKDDYKKKLSLGETDEE